MNPLISLVLFFLGAHAFSATSNDNVAVYWGQNSVGSQQPLATYCRSNSADIVILSFLYQFPNVQLNFANACEGSYTDAGTLHCPLIAADIKTCQGLGKKVLLSLGGASGAYGFSSETEGTQFASKLWNTFGNGPDKSNRPFDDAIVDGFDFDIENNNQVGYVGLGKELRNLFAKDTSRKYYLSAAPQCPYPDASVGDLLEQVNIDFAFIQFYNNYCSLGPDFNWDTWVQYAQNTSPNKDIKLFVGLPGSTAAAGSGYNDPATVSKFLTSDILKSPHFGGISLWDAASAWANVQDGKNFAESMKLIVSDGTGSEKAVDTAVELSSTSAPAFTSSAVATIKESSAVTSAAATSAAVTTAETSAVKSAASSYAESSEQVLPTVSTPSKPSTLSTVVYTPSKVITSAEPNGVKTVFTTAFTTIKITTIVAN